MNIEWIQKTLEPTENPGLDITDPRLMEIPSQAQDGDYLGAAAAAQAVFEEGIYDIRLLGFFLYGLFLEGGIRNLGDIFDGFARFLDENWAMAGPEQKREKHAQVAFRWFFNQMIKKLQHEQSSQGDAWSRWIEETTSDDVEKALDAADKLRRSLGAVLEDASGPILEGLGKTVEWLRPFQQLVYREDEPEGHPEDEGEESLEEEAEDWRREGEKVVPAGGVVQPEPVKGAATRSSDVGGLCIEGSYHLEMLMKKLEAFERLMAEEKYPRAALVADDIMETISQFDPRLYFPKLFRRFFMLMATHSEDLMSFEEMKESPEWQVMREYYKVDLDGFVDF